MLRNILIGLLLLALILVTLALTGKREFRARIDIPAPPEAVWAVLTDTASYPDWNPVFVKVEGTHSPGATVTNTVLGPAGDALVIDAQVLEMTPPGHLRQTGGVPYVVTFDHTWTLMATGAGTRVEQYEVDRGDYMWIWDSDWIEPAYARVNEALKARVLALAARNGD